MLSLIPLLVLMPWAHARDIPSFSDDPEDGIDGYGDYSGGGKGGGGGGGGYGDYGGGGFGGGSWSGGGGGFGGFNWGAAYWGGGWNGWGASKDGWGRWGSEWDWGNWDDGVVPFVIPGNPPAGSDGAFYGRVVEADSNKFKLEVEQCSAAAHSPCRKALATYHVQGVNGGLQAHDDSTWSVSCKFPRSTFTPRQSDNEPIYSTVGGLSPPTGTLTGYAYNSPVCTEGGVGEPTYTANSYLWPGDAEEFSFTEPGGLSTTRTARPRPRKTSNSGAVDAGFDEPEDEDEDAGEDKGEDQNEDDDSDDSLRKRCGGRRCARAIAVQSDDVYTTVFSPDNFIRLTITEGKDKLKAACTEWLSHDRLGGPGGWAGYGGWGGYWGEATRSVAPSETVTVFKTITTDGYVTAVPTLVQAKNARKYVHQSSGSGLASKWACMSAISLAAAVVAIACL